MKWTGFVIGVLIVGFIGVLIADRQSEGFSGPVVVATDEPVAAADAEPILRRNAEVLLQEDEGDEEDEEDEEDKREPGNDTTQAAVGEAVEQPVAAASRHYFWSPFTSRASAAGFASQVMQRAGMPIEVERRGDGNFSVWFEYTDTADLAAKRAHFSERTGFTLQPQEKGDAP